MIWAAAKIEDDMVDWSQSMKCAGGVAIRRVMLNTGGGAHDEYKESTSNRDAKKCHPHSFVRHNRSDSTKWYKIPSKGLYILTHPPSSQSCS